MCASLLGAREGDDVGFSFHPRKLHLCGVFAGGADGIAFGEVIRIWRGAQIDPFVADLECAADRTSRGIVVFLEGADRRVRGAGDRMDKHTADGQAIVGGGPDRQPVQPPHIRPVTAVKDTEQLLFDPAGLKHAEQIGTGVGPFDEIPNLPPQHMGRGRPRRVILYGEGVPFGSDRDDPILAVHDIAVCLEVQ